MLCRSTYVLMDADSVVSPLGVILFESSRSRQIERHRSWYPIPMEIYLLPEALSNWLDSRGRSHTNQRLHLGYFLSNVMVVALLPLVHLVPHFCLMQALVAIPCPGCGVTRALVLAMSLRLRESAMANPAGLVIAATIGFQPSHR